MVAIRLDAHGPEFHRKAPPQLPVRCATTANITIATALNSGDTIDGVTLADGNRVLVKDQSTGADNGIYIVGATPSRAADFMEGLAAYGAVVTVVTGTANGGKTFRCTNTTVPTIGSTALTFSDYTPGGSGAPTTADYLVGTTQAGLSAEIVVGTTPGGELGNTWASPTVDATHSGSAHTDFIAKSLLTTQDDIIVRDGTGPARLAKGSDGQVLTVDPTTHHLVWATPTTGGAPTTVDYLVGTADAGLSAEIVVGTTPGGELGGTWASPTVDATHSGSAHHARQHSTTDAADHTFPGGTVNFLRADGTFADPSVPAGTSFNQAVYGPGSDGTVTVSAPLTLTRDMYYDTLTNNDVIDPNGWRIYCKTEAKGTGVFRRNGGNGGNGGNGTGAAGGAAGTAGASTSANNLGRGAAGTIGRIGGFNAVGLNGTAGQKSNAFRANSATAIDHAVGANGGAGANAGGTGAAAQAGDNVLDAKPYAYPACVEWHEMGGNSSIPMDPVSGKAPGGGSGGGSATGGGGGSGGAGAGGGPVVLVAKTWSGSFTIESKGGNGGNGGNGFVTSGNNGGGAAGNGGAGGAVVGIYSDRTGWSGSISVAGGAHGTGGTGNGGGANGGNGSDGPAGMTLEYRIS